MRKILVPALNDICDRNPDIGLCKWYKGESFAPVKPNLFTSSPFDGNSNGNFFTPATSPTNTDNFQNINNSRKDNVISSSNSQYDSYCQKYGVEYNFFCRRSSNNVDVNLFCNSYSTTCHVALYRSRAH